MSHASAARLPWLALLTVIGLLVSACVSISDSQVSPSTSDAPTSSSAAPLEASPGTGSPSATPGTAASSAARPELADRPTIGYLALDERLPYVGVVGDGIRAAVSDAGYALVECDSGWSREGALGCATDFAEAGIHGLISFQPFADAAEQICDTIGGVPTVGIVFDQGSCQVSTLDIDQAESGRLAGEAMGRFAEDRWQCQLDAFVSLESGPSDPAGRERMQGYRDGFAEQCDLPETLHQIDGADRLATAQKKMSELLPDLSGHRIVVVGLNEDAILGAIAAAASAGRAADLWYSGQLADPSIRQRIACDEHYVASVAQFPIRFGGLVVPALVAAIQGQGVVPVIEGPLQLVDAQNVRELYPDTRSCGE